MGEVRCGLVLITEFPWLSHAVCSEPVEPTESELLDAWRAGDRDAGSVLFERYYAPLGRFFRNKVGEERDELVQRTFAGCVEGRERFRGDGRFRSYLFGIAVNVLRRYIQQKRRSDTIDPMRSSVVQLGVAGPASVVGARREQQILLEALRRLPLNDQVVLELFYWESMDSAEIGEIVGLPRGTVRSRLRLARERLRGHVDEIARTPAELQSTVDGMDRWVAGVREQLVT